uniref:Tc1-like transposase DDE domain-containing protein n=1 Tax=Oreochromis aureus TaxID=47969 RepID=A0AAZ1WW62_OREAU
MVMDNGSKHTTKLTKQWLQDHTDLKIPLERLYKEKWKKLPKDMSTKLEASNSKSLMAVITAKGASTRQ